MTHVRNFFFYFFKLNIVLIRCLFIGLTSNSCSNDFRLKGILQFILCLVPPNKRSKHIINDAFITYKCLLHLNSVALGPFCNIRIDHWRNKPRKENEFYALLIRSYANSQFELEEKKWSFWRKEGPMSLSSPLDRYYSERTE